MSHLDDLDDLDVWRNAVVVAFTEKAALLDRYRATLEWIKEYSKDDWAAAMAEDALREEV